MISIIVPIYNTEKYLPKCLDSLIGQSYRDIEIICVDDGSSDGSLKVLEAYREKDDRVVVISQENSGVSEARNNGIAKAQGDWLMFVDSDDWLEYDTCEQVIKCGEHDLVFFSYIREFKKTSASKQVLGNSATFYEKDSLDYLYERLIAPKGNELRYPDKLDSLSTLWGKLYRTAIIKNNGILMSSSHERGTLEDLLFNVQYFKYMHNAYYLPSYLYHYRKTRGDSIVYSYKPDLEDKWLSVYSEIERSFPIRKKQELTDALQRREALCLFGLGLNITFSKTGWNKECRMLSKILHSEWYTSAIKKLPLSAMPLHWRCFYTMAKWKQTWAVLLMLNVMNRIINR